MFHAKFYIADDRMIVKKLFQNDPNTNVDLYFHFKCAINAIDYVSNDHIFLMLMLILTVNCGRAAFFSKSNGQKTIFNLNFMRTL